MNRLIVRRGLVIAHFTSFTSGMILIPRWLNGNTAPFTTLALIAIYIVSTIALFTFAHPYRVEGFKPRIPPAVDERQRAVRDGALAWSYWFTSFLLVALLSWFALGTLIPSLWHPVDLDQLVRVFWVLVMVSSILPAAFVAWREPELPEESSVPVGGLR